MSGRLSSSSDSSLSSDWLDPSSPFDAPSPPMSSMSSSSSSSTSGPSCSITPPPPPPAPSPAAVGAAPTSMPAAAAAAAACCCCSWRICFILLLLRLRAFRLSSSCATASSTLPACPSASRSMMRTYCLSLMLSLIMTPFLRAFRLVRSSCSGSGSSGMSAALRSVTTHDGSSVGAISRPLRTSRDDTAADSSHGWWCSWSPDADAGGGAAAVAVAVAVLLLAALLNKGSSYSSK
mmetsp:Transcript_39001/g.111449  ORF Transcript_39001/g.111449 Transcript_39001/m.111449 type:complete len:235 (-) Transcript_39001:1927-2631(-)